jgi:hypothetical protein
METRLPAEIAATIAPYRVSLDLDQLDHREGDPAVVARALEVAAESVPEGARRWARDKYRVALEYAGRAHEARDVARELLQASARDPKERALAVNLMLELGQLPEAAAAADAQLDADASDQDALFVSAIAHLLLDDDVARHRAEQLLFWSDHRSADYVRLLLAWRLRKSGEDMAAQELLEWRLRAAGSTDESARRLSMGDLGPWREMLMRYSLDPSDEHRRAIFDPLESERAFKDSRLVGGAQSFSAFRCEALFYDGLLQSVVGDPDSRDARFADRLQKVSEERCFRTYERSMARWLLSNELEPAEIERR